MSIGWIYDNERERKNGNTEESRVKGDKVDRHSTNLVLTVMVMYLLEDVM